jgi:hypothetical protein
MEFNVIIILGVLLGFFLVFIKLQKSSAKTKTENCNRLTLIDKEKLHNLIEKIETVCSQLKQGLESELQKATDEQHAEGWQRDIITMDNILLAATDIKKDLNANIIGKCLERVLRQTMHETRNKLSLIPLRKELHNEINNSFKELHGMIYRLMH